MSFSQVRKESNVWIKYPRFLLVSNYLALLTLQLEAFLGTDLSALNPNVNKDHECPNHFNAVVSAFAHPHLKY